MTTDFMQKKTPQTTKQDQLRKGMAPTQVPEKYSTSFLAALKSCYKPFSEWEYRQEEIWYARIYAIVAVHVCLSWGSACSVGKYI